jgi:hypothetical protein
MMGARIQEAKSLMQEVLQDKELIRGEEEMDVVEDEEGAGGGIIDEEEEGMEDVDGVEVEEGMEDGEGEGGF